MPSTQSAIPQSGRYAIEEIFDTQPALSCTDIEAWSDLLAEDVIMEIPYYIDRAYLGLPKQSIE
jgi:hypothetical protein